MITLINSLQNLISETLIEPLGFLMLDYIKPLPKHIAFIMDGNRRFARKHNLPIAAGHFCGFQQLERILKWCLRLELKEVTIYAFSLENFKRPSEEVDALMDLLVDKLYQLSENTDWVKENQLKIRFKGDLSQLNERARKACENAMWNTKNHHKATLTICCPYTSRDEILRALKEYSHDAELFQVNPDEFERRYLQSEQPVDMLIRTSGETRLSDFLLWQTSNSYILFISCLWPEFSFLHFVYSLLMFTNSRSFLKYQF